MIKQNLIGIICIIVIALLAIRSHAASPNLKNKTNAYEIVSGSTSDLNSAGN